MAYFKGLVAPKIKKNLLLFYYAVPNKFELISSEEHKMRTSEKSYGLLLFFLPLQYKVSTWSFQPS